jgi:MFS family permease
MPITIVMFTLSRRAGRLADRFGPRWFMGGGPLVAGRGPRLLQRVDAHVDYWTDLLPALLLFALGLSATVAPLTATVLADADEHNAGIASGVNNAIARVAGLLAVAALGAVVATQFGSGDGRAPGGPSGSRPRRRRSSRRPSSARWRAPTPRAAAGRGARGDAGRAGRLGERLPSRRGHRRGTRGARRPARIAGIRNAARGSRARAAPAASSRGRRSRPAARRALPADDVTRPQQAAHRAQIPACAAAQGRPGPCSRAGPARRCRS